MKIMRPSNRLLSSLKFFGASALLNSGVIGAGLVFADKVTVHQHGLSLEIGPGMLLLVSGALGGIAGILETVVQETYKTSKPAIVSIPKAPEI